MRQIKLLVAVMTFLISSTITVYAQDAKQEPAPAAAPDAKQDVPKQEAGPEHPGGHAATKEKRFTATVGPDGTQQVNITGGEYYFDPNYIIVKVNVPVVLTVKKEKGFVPHDIVVKAPEAGIDFKVDISDKDAKTVKFTPLKVGKYEMKCDKRLLFFKSHEERGMKGTIEVVP